MSAIESDFKVALKDAFDSTKNLWHQRVHDTYTRGLPDFMVLYGGRAFALEAKVNAPENPLQQSTLVKIARAGSTAAFVRGERVRGVWAVTMHLYRVEGDSWTTDTFYFPNIAIFVATVITREL